MKKIGMNFSVNLKHARIYNRHIEARLLMHGKGIPNAWLRAPCQYPRNENERLLIPPLTFGIRKVLLDPFRGFNEIDCIVIVLFNACCNCKDIGIKNYIFRRESGFFSQED